MKKYALLILLASWPISGTPKKIQERYVASYINQCIEHWFYPNQHHQSLAPLANRITQEIFNNLPPIDNWSWSTWNYERQYNQEQVEQLLRGAILDHIRDGSYQYAYQLTHNNSRSQQVADHIFQELFNICQKSTYLQNGVFSSFIGNDLRARVEELVNWFGHTQQSIATPKPLPPLYTSAQCIICMEDFPEVPRVYLTPCGHDICAYCADRWFFGENKTSCPHCRATIDRYQLKQAIKASVYYAL